VRCFCDHAEDFPHDAESEHCDGCEHSEETVGTLSQSQSQDGLFCGDCINDPEIAT
jgi:hypothetical protein